tara:strand:- start:177 stop:842 length:666 start_codon:yes stop_codon:yes gene_type:complete
VRVLGLDPSLTNFGWAIHNSSVDGSDRCESRGRFQTSSKTLFVDRYVDLRERLFNLCEQTQPDAVGIEYPVFGDLFSEGMYGLFLYSCEALKAAKMDTVFFAPTQIKTIAKDIVDRPKGWRMVKSDMVEAAKMDTGGKGRWNHNEADAYLVAMHSARFWGVQKGLISVDQLSEKELKQFNLIHTYTKGKNAGKTVRRGILHRADERYFLWSGDLKDAKEKV